MAALSNRILVGTNDPATASYIFENDDIFSIEGEMAVGVIGDELTIDTLSPTVRQITDPSDALYSADNDDLWSNDDDDLWSYDTPRLQINYGTPVWYYNNNQLSGKFYVESVERTGREQYRISCFSVIGLLDTKTHAGAVYKGETFSTVLTSILDGTLTSSEYEIEATAASINVYGWLPYDTARNNLHKLLMAYNVSMVKSDDGSKIKFCFLGSDSATAIPDSRVYINGSVDYGKMPTKVSITEHTYIAYPEGVEEVELFNNSDSGVPASNEVVPFDEPIIPSTVRGEGRLRGSGWTVNDDAVLGDEVLSFNATSGNPKTFYYHRANSYGETYLQWTNIIVTAENASQIIGKYGQDIDDTSKYFRVDTVSPISGTSYLRVSGHILETPPTTTWSDPANIHDNYALVTGVGKLYGKPYTHQSKEMEYTTGASGVENVASLTDNTLITVQNGRNVADRLIDYYGHADTEKLEIKMDGEKTGKKYSFTNAFSEQKTGLLTRITMYISSFIKAAVEVVTGLQYPGRGTLYNKVFRQANWSNWVVPAGVTKVRAVLIGGGSGGDSGYAGEPGQDATTSGGAGGEGGAGGKGGKGGRIYSVELNVTPGDVIACAPGRGGAGGNGANATHDTNVPGSEGENATITHNGTTYSSASGYPSESGFYEFINRSIYGRPSLHDGIAGGNGGKGGTSKDYAYDDTTVGEAGGNVGSRTGGAGGLFGTFNITVPSGNTLSLAYSLLAQVISSTSISWMNARYHGTGGGSGACATSNGNAGTGASGTGTSSSSSSTYLFNILAHGMNGGNGVQPSTPTDEYKSGNGGAGGHGGSGGGGGGATNTTLSTASVNAGTTTCVNIDTKLDGSYTNCKGGAGGAGGNGQDGCNGLILFYYEQ